MTETEKVPGLFTALGDAFSAIGRAWHAALFGIEIIPDDRMEPGAAIVMDGKTFMHPFDVFAVKHGKDYTARLDAVAEYIGQEAGRKADRIIARLEQDTLRDRIAQHAAVPVEYLKPVIWQDPDGTWPERPKPGPVMYIGSDRYPAPPGELIDDEWLIRPVAHRAVSRRERWRAAVATWLEEHLP